MSEPSKRYRIVITEITEDIPTTRRDWKKVVSDEVWEKMSWNDREEKYGNEQFAYKTVEDTTSETVELYNQTVSDLNLQDVVAVVNRIKEVK